MVKTRKCSVCENSVEEDYFPAGMSLCYGCVENLRARAYRDLESLPRVIIAIGDCSLPRARLITERLEGAIDFLHMAELLAGRWGYPKWDKDKP